MKSILIIPAYNEEKSILKTVRKIENYNKKIKENKKKGKDLDKDIIDYIVINDGSKDATQKILEDNNINHVNLVINLGIGGAVQTGYKYAKDHGYDVAVQFDGDGQHDINYVEKILKPLKEKKADMVIGSRFVGDESKFKSSASRRIGIRIISQVIKFKTKKKIYDTTSGFRAVNKELIDFFSKDYPFEYPEPISTVSVLNLDKNVEEVSVSMNEREAGTSSIHAWKNIYYMINVIFTILVLRKSKKQK